MRALILAAGLGTRLKPWTLEHPKALVPVAGEPMLERVLTKLEVEGFDRIVVNVHHFGDQIIDYLENRQSRAKICISDERDCLLDTGGGILQADSVLGGDGPLLVHNVDILSNAPLSQLMQYQIETDAAATLLTSLRDSTRRLAFDSDDRLRGWHDLRTGSVKPYGYVAGSLREEAFSGIYAIHSKAIEKMRAWAASRSFPVMDFLLDNCLDSDFRRFCLADLRMLDIGKPDALTRAEDFIRSL